LPTDFYYLTYDQRVTILAATMNKPTQQETILLVIQCDQKVSVHLMITIRKRLHRDFLITLYTSNLAF